MTRPQHSLYEQSWPEGEYRFFQLGHVVDDVHAAAATWARVFGIGPFHVMPILDLNLATPDGPRTVSIQVAVAQAGPVQIELVQQHCDRPSIFREWSRNGTSAFHQLATVTPDYEGRKAHYERLGYRLVGESAPPPFRVAYFDTVADFGFYTEVVEQTPGFLRQLQRFSETSATWDGTDPVRLLPDN